MSSPSPSVKLGISQPSGVVPHMSNLEKFDGTTDCGRQVSVNHAVYAILLFKLITSSAGQDLDTVNYVCAL